MPSPATTDKTASGSCFDPGQQQRDVDAKIVAALERLAHAMNNALQDASYAQELSPTQAQFLVYLLYREDSEHNLTELARHFRLRVPTVSDVVSTLVAKGLIERNPSHWDRRMRLVRLTAEGRRKARRIAQWAESLRWQVRQMDAEVKPQFLATLLHLIARLQQAGLITVARCCTTCLYFQPGVHDDPQRPHHCGLLDIPLYLHDLRADCPDHKSVLAGGESRPAQETVSKDP
ncbi:MAG: MarR family transcriptional regulator [Gemmataceae bacterium]